MTKNFGFNIDNYGNSGKLLEYIESIYHDVLEQERRIKRNPRFEDNRVHVALYFIRAGCNRLQELDIECMKAISARINLLPIVAKIDAVNEIEFSREKSMIENELRKHDIKVWDFLQNIDHRDEEEVEYLKFLQTKVPFGIINSNLTTLNHQYRKNKIGKIDVEDETICDNKVLKTVLFGSHLQEFKENTIATKYEAFRVEQLENQT
jgi:septin family protein